MTVTRLYIAIALLLVLLLLLPLAGCASTGLYNMSDSWCDANPQAPNFRCPGHTYSGRGNTP